MASKGAVDGFTYRADWPATLHRVSGAVLAERIEEHWSIDVDGLETVCTRVSTSE